MPRSGDDSLGRHLGHQLDRQPRVDRRVALLDQSERGRLLSGANGAGAGDALPREPVSGSGARSGCVDFELVTDLDALFPSDIDKDQVLDGRYGLLVLKGDDLGGGAAGHGLGEDAGPHLQGLDAGRAIPEVDRPVDFSDDDGGHILVDVDDRAHAGRHEDVAVAVHVAVQAVEHEPVCQFRRLAAGVANEDLREAGDVEEVAGDSRGRSRLDRSDDLATRRQFVQRDQHAATIEIVIGHGHPWGWLEPLISERAFGLELSSGEDGATPGDLYRLDLLLIGRRRRYHDIFVFVGGVGAIRMPDLFTRMHATSVTDTLGRMLIIGGLMLQAGFELVTLKLAAILVFLLLTSPVSGYALANSALLSGHRPLGVAEEEEVR